MMKNGEKNLNESNINYLCNEIKEQIDKQDTRLRCAIGFNNKWYTNNYHNSGL